MNNSTLVKLGDVVDYQTGHPFKSKEYVDEGVRLLRGDNIGQGFLRWDGAKFWPEETSDKIKAFYLEPGDVVLAMDRPWIEAGLKYSVVLPSDLPALLVQRVSRLRGTPSLDGGFLRYLIGSQEFTNYILDITTGTAVPHISGRDILAYEFELPKLERQREIASILGALDDKIELNRRMSATLENMARSLYRSWFVDFDPVHAKMEGRQPAFMDEATAALFPDRLGEDGLPEGWELGSVADVFNVVMGQSPPGNTYNEDGEGLPFYQGRTDFGFRFPTRRKFCSAPKRIAAKDCVLLSVRAPVGDLNRAWEECCIGRGVASLSEKSGRNTYGYEAIWALSEDLKSYESEGTVFGSINKKQLSDLKLVIPTEDLQDAFETLTKPMDDQVRNITANNQTLAALRDSLLPKLMSGELRVAEAREQIEEVA